MTDYCVPHFAQFFKPGSYILRGGKEVRSNNRRWPSRISIDLVCGLAFPSSSSVYLRGNSSPSRACEGGAGGGGGETEISP